jgi:hypothetical protein
MALKATNTNNPALVTEPVEVKRGVKMYRAKDFGEKIVAKQNYFYAKIDVWAQNG